MISFLIYVRVFPLIVVSVSNLYPTVEGRGVLSGIDGENRVREREDNKRLNKNEH
jgi:hypothetical protein